MLTKVVIVKEGVSDLHLDLESIFCLFFLLSHIKSEGEDGEDAGEGVIKLRCGDRNEEAPGDTALGCERKLS